MQPIHILCTDLIESACIAGSSYQLAIGVSNPPFVVAKGINQTAGHAQLSVQQVGSTLQEPAHWQPVTAAITTAATRFQQVVDNASQPSVVAPNMAARAGNDVHQNACAVLLTGNSHEGYFMPLRVGKQEFDVQVDTGSPNLALPGDGCVNCGANITHPYLPGAGSFDLRINDYLEYGSGYLYGNFYLDNVQASNFQPKQLAVMRVVASSKTMLTDRNMPGLLGLGPNSSGYLDRHGFDHIGNDSYMVALTEAQGLLAVQLCDSGGFIWFGTHNCSHSQADPFFEYVAMPQANFYYAVLGSMSLKDEEVNPSPTTAIFDTGAGWLLLARDVYKVFMDNLQENSYVQQLGGFDSMGCMKETPHPTSNIDDYLPDLTVGFISNLQNGSTQLKKTIPASKSYMVQRRQGGKLHWCHVVLQNYATDGHIFGAPMMRQFVIMFDTSTNRLGFAPQEPSTCPVNPQGPSPMPPSAPPPPHIKQKIPWWIVLSTVCMVASIGGVVLGVFLYRKILVELLLTTVGMCSRPHPGTLEARLTEQYQPLSAF